MNAVKKAGSAILLSFVPHLSFCSFILSPPRLRVKMENLSLPYAILRFEGPSFNTFDRE